ncbi:MAG: hypothetical protein ABIA93_07455 [Candidatus Woesearchaeota archaeon]
MAYTLPTYVKDFGEGRPIKEVTMEWHKVHRFLDNATEAGMLEVDSDMTTLIARQAYLMNPADASRAIEEVYNQPFTANNLLRRVEDGDWSDLEADLATLEEETLEAQVAYW